VVNRIEDSGLSMNLVGGRWRPSSDGSVIDVRDPSDLRHIVGQVPSMTVEDVIEAYDHAERGFETWRRTNALDRGTVLAGAARLLRERQEDVAMVIVDEMGKTTAEAMVEVTKTAEFFDYYASLARLPYGELLHDARPGTRTSTWTEPIGVVLAITPWNDPLLTPARKLAPALAAGNAVLIKPSQETPLIAHVLARVLTEAGLPDGVLGTVTGVSRVISAALLGDRRLAAVTFTGSTAVGRQLERQLAGTGIRLQAELGGKNASVVLADADLELAAATIAAAAFAQTGQRCTATSRLIVEESVAEQLLDDLVRRAKSLVLGPGRDASTTVGPLVSADHRDAVLGHVEAARAEGGRVRVGGTVPTDDRLGHGCFFEPTVVDQIEPRTGLWRDEVFGPVLAVTTATGLDDALTLVNDSPYGLAAALFTTDIRASATFLDRAEVGQVAVNLPTSGWDVHQPFGGFRDSGSPFKEQGASGLRFYTRIKTAAVRSSW
jgi:alpha-ketoglutaric semialdehyde dehydrogenase